MIQRQQQQQSRQSFGYGGHHKDVHAQQQQEAASFDFRYGIEPTPAHNPPKRKD